MCNFAESGVMVASFWQQASRQTREALRRNLFAKERRMRNARPIVTFTFDDFPRSAATRGAPILERYGARGTFYAAGHFMNETDEGIEYYTASDLAVLRGAGHEIGCHTFGHLRVSQLSSHDLTTEIERNAVSLKPLLGGSRLANFAYPFGDLSFSATNLLQKKFDTCRATIPGLNEGTADLGRLRAVRLYGETGNRDGLSALIAEAAAKCAWLIFYTHDVCDRPTKFGCTEELLEYTVSAAAASGAELLPVCDALRKI